MARITTTLFEKRFTVLATTLLIYVFALAPVTDRSALWDDVTRGVLIAVVLTSVYTCIRRGRLIIGLGVAAAIVIVLAWLARSSPNDEDLAVANYLATGGLLLCTAVLVITDVVSTTRVTRDTILGAVSAYLLLGLVFAMAYAAEYTVSPDAFDLPVWAESRTAGGSVAADLRTFTYFSFVTLSTLGYGDVLPASRATQATAAGQAIIGQLFLAVTVARIVALQISHKGEG